MRELAVLGATVAVLLTVWAAGSASGGVCAERDRVADGFAVLVVGHQGEVLCRLRRLTDDLLKRRAGLSLLIEGLDKVAAAVKDHVVRRPPRLARCGLNISHAAGERERVFPGGEVAGLTGGSEAQAAASPADRTRRRLVSRLWNPGISSYGETRT